MSLGREVFRAYDDYGPLLVFDDGNKRYLSFSELDEQSCQLKSNPFQLQHDYSQAMLLVLLFCKPGSMLLLGLGGGTLVTTLHHILADLTITVVELRPKVVDVAYRYFQMPRCKRISVVIDDAGEFISQSESEKVDVLFSDIYGEEGLDLQQTQDWFIAACAERLNDDGWLVLNCWQHQRGDKAMRHALRAYFEDVRVCATAEGNWVVLAGKKANASSAAQLKSAAKKWSKLLGFSLLSSLSRLNTLT